LKKHTSGLFVMVVCLACLIVVGVLAVIIALETI
jgi:hypothetical protein